MSVRAWIDGCHPYSVHSVKLLNKYEQKQTKIVSQSPKRPGEDDVLVEYMSSLSSGGGLSAASQYVLIGEE